MKAWLWALALLVVLLLVYGAWRADGMTKRERAWLAQRDSLNGALAAAAEIQRARERERDEWRRVADSLAHAARPLPPERPTLPSAAPPAGTASDSAAYWKRDATAARGLADSLQRDNADLRAEIGRQRSELAARAHLQALDSASIHDLTRDRDRLQAQLNNAPVGRKRGINLLGVRLCPVVGPGYAGVLAGGTVHAGVAMAVIQPLSCR